METRRQTRKAWKDYLPNSVRRVLRPIANTVISILPSEYRERLPEEIRISNVSRQIREIQRPIEEAARSMKDRLDTRETVSLQGYPEEITLNHIALMARTFYPTKEEREAYLNRILEPQLAAIAIAKMAGQLAAEKERRIGKKLFAYIRGFIEEYAPEMADQILDKQGRIRSMAQYYLSLIFDIPDGYPLPPVMERYIAPVSWSLRDVPHGGPLKMELTGEDVNAISYKPFSHDEEVVVIRPRPDAPILPTSLFKPKYLRMWINDRLEKGLQPTNPRTSEVLQGLSQMERRTLKLKKRDRAKSASKLKSVTSRRRPSKNRSNE